MSPCQATGEIKLVVNSNTDQVGSHRARKIIITRQFYAKDGSALAMYVAMICHLL